MSFWHKPADTKGQRPHHTYIATAHRPRPPPVYTEMVNIAILTILDCEELLLCCKFINDNNQRCIGHKFHIDSVPLLVKFSEMFKMSKMGP